MNSDKFYVVEDVYNKDNNEDNKLDELQNNYAHNISFVSIFRKYKNCGYVSNNKSHNREIDNNNDSDDDDDDNDDNYV